jgi:hypothetical protein
MRGQKYTFLFCAHQHQTLTTLSSKARSTSSVLCGVISISLLAADSTVFCKLNNCLSHIMVDVFVEKLAYKNSGDTILGVPKALPKF